jgi:hypothetical protein
MRWPHIAVFSLFSASWRICDREDRAEGDANLTELEVGPEQSNPVAATSVMKK